MKGQSKPNLNKAVSANQNGITVSFHDTNKHWFMPYENKYVKNIQLHGNAKYQVTERSFLNKTQQRIYAEAVYGLSYFTTKQLDEMAPARKSQIITHYEKVQVVFNVWKQQLTSLWADKWMQTIFPKSSVTKAFCDTQGYDHTLEDHQSFRDLGITQPMIVDKLLNAGLLPEGFLKIAV